MFRAKVALREKEAAILSKSSRALRFSGSASTTIPAGAIIISDAVDLSVPPTSDLVVDLYVPGDTAAIGSPVTMHTGANQTSYVSSTGNYVGADTLPVATTTGSWFMLARVEVIAPQATGAIVAIGDSITDGTRSTPNTNHRWPDLLARRLIRSERKGVELQNHTRCADIKDTFGPMVTAIIQAYERQERGKGKRGGRR